MTKHARLPRYDTLFAGNSPAISARTQTRLRTLRVGIVGVGGVGTNLAQILAQLGVGTLVVIDPQRLELENFNRMLGMTLTDVGAYKSRFFADSLKHRLHLSIKPIVGSVEGGDGQTALRNVDVICCTSNTISSRLATTRLAHENRVPLISAGVADASTRCAGQILIWSPLRRHLACDGCFLPDAQSAASVGVVLPSVATWIAAAAAHALWTGVDNGFSLTGPNLICLDLDTPHIEALTVCGKANCNVGKHSNQ